MARVRRTTIYLDPDLHRELRVKAAETGTGVSEFVNAALQRSLCEDSADLAAFDTRAGEPVVGFSAVLGDLKRSRKL